MGRGIVHFGDFLDRDHSGVALPEGLVVNLETVKCDVCGKTKGEANKWFVFQFWATHCLLMRWHDALKEDIERGKHLCGQGCALKITSLWMED